MHHDHLLRDAGARHRALFLSATTYDLPLPAGQARGWDALSRRIELRVIGRRGAARGADERFRLLHAPSGAAAGRLFYPRLLLALPREVRRFRPDAVVTQSPFEAVVFLLVAPLLRPRPQLVVQVHGDWRTAGRLYGSAVRRVLAPVADRAAGWALRRADGVRAVGAWTAGLAERATGRPPVAVYPTYFDLSSFTATPRQPLPEHPSIAYVGMLEWVKGVDVLAAAWERVVARVPSARLVIVGRGRRRAEIDALAARCAGTVRVIDRCSPQEVAALLDASTALVLPSRSEGTPRVVLEAFARGRPVVASDAGGIPDLVEHERNGLLAKPEDADALAAALVRLLVDRGLAERLATEAGRSAVLDWTPERFSLELVTCLTKVAGKSAPCFGVA